MTAIERPHLQFPFQRTPLPGPFKGPWSASGDFAVGDIVQYAQAFYQSVLAWNAARRSNYGRTVLEDNPVAYWRLGDPANSRVAIDELGTLPPNLILNPSIDTDQAFWQLSGTHTTLTVLASGAMFGTAGLQIATASGGSYEGTVYLISGYTFKAGVSYWVSAYMKGAVGGESVQLDSFNNVSGRQTMALPQLTTSWQRYAFQVIPAVDETGMYLYARFVGTNSGTFYLDGVQVVQSDQLPPYYAGTGGNAGSIRNLGWPANLYPNPRAAANITSFQSTSGVITQNLTAPAGLPNQILTAFTATMNGGGILNFYRNVGGSWDGNVSQNTTYTFSAYVRSTTAPQTFTLQVTWYDASNASITTVNQTPSVVGTTTGWTRLMFTTTSPALAAHFLTRVVTTNIPANGEVIHISCIQVTISQQAVGYCDTQSVITQTTGAIGGSGDTDKSMLLDGSGSGYVRVENAPVFQSQQFSHEMWVNGQGLLGTQRPMAFGAYAFNGFVIDYSGSNVQFLIGDGTKYNGGSPVAAVRGQWHHLALTYDGTTCTMYVDGVAASSVVSGYAPNTASNAPNGIGARGDGGWSFSGYVDEAAFYTYALTPAQITEHYTVGKGTFVPQAPTPDMLPEWELSNGSTVQVVEQDTPEHVMSCEMVIVSCPLGYRDDRPDFGWAWPELQTMPLDLSGLEQALERFEPRGDADVTQHADYAAAVVTANVDVLIKEG